MSGWYAIDCYRIAITRTLLLDRSKRKRMGLDRIGLPINDDIFELQTSDPGSVELVVLDSDVEVF